MFLVKFSDFELKKFLQNVLQQTLIPITFFEDDKYFSILEIDNESEIIIIKSNKKILKLSLPLTFENLISSIKGFLSDYNIEVQQAIYYPVNNIIIYENKKTVLGEIHNKILSHLILNKKSGLDKIKLYQFIWPLDKEIYMNKLDTHLSNFRNILAINLNFEIQFSSSKGIIKLN